MKNLSLICLCPWLALSLTLVACGDGKENSKGKIARRSGTSSGGKLNKNQSYEVDGKDLSGKACTAKKSFPAKNAKLSKAERCRFILDDKYNDFCANEERRIEYQKTCLDKDAGKNTQSNYIQWVRYRGDDCKINEKLEAKSEAELLMKVCQYINDDKKNGDCAKDQRDLDFEDYCTFKSE